MKKLFSSLALIILITACKKTGVTVQSDNQKGSASPQKQGDKNLPEVSTAPAIYILPFGATSGGAVNGGGNSIKERGVCISTNPNPTIADTKVPSGAGPGDFITSLPGLAGNTTYYIRAYAIKSNNDIYYGNEVNFTTADPEYGTATDFDGNVYTTIKIGSQTWTVENLKTTHYKDGTLIPNVTDDMAWYNLNTGAWCSYNNDNANITTYGRLYNWAAVSDAHGLAPAGWHVPTYTEWYTTLMNELGGLNGCLVAGKKLKDNTLWNGDNSSGFKALPGGRRNSGDFYNGPGSFYSFLNSGGCWWTSTSLVPPGLAWFLGIDQADQSCGISGGNEFNKKNGYSIRLVKD